jgi:predicted DNA binding CopG/RHH family protein
MKKINYNKVINVRLNSNDLDVLAEKAKQNRMPISTYIRSELTKNLKSNG